MSAPAYVLGHDVVSERDEVLVGSHVAVVSFVDAPAVELDAGQVAATEDVGLGMRRRWRAQVVGGASDGQGASWGKSRGEAVDKLVARVGEQR